MRYLSGVPYAPCLTWEHGGLMFTPEMGNKRLRLDGVTWAADNGCFTAGDRFSATRWLDWLSYWQPYAANCLFAVLPDAPFNHAETLARSLPYVEQVRQLGYVPALAIQEGATPENIPWDYGIGALFIAGGKPDLQPLPLWADVPRPTAKATRAFKTSPVVRAICREGIRRGFRLHSARNNSFQAVQDACDIGCTSVDGTFIKYAPDQNWLRVQRWFDKLCTHEMYTPVWGADARFGKCRTCGADVWRVTGENIKQEVSA